MKKITVVCLVLMLSLLLCACGNGGTQAEPNTPVGPGTPSVGPGNTEKPSEDAIPSVNGVSLLKEGSCGTSATFQLYENGVLVVSGSGTVSEAFAKFNDYVKYIKIEEGITSIGNKVFSGLKSCVMAELPSTLKSIDVAAFANSSSLEKVNLPQGLESIGKNAFYFAGLTAVEIPGSLKTMGGGAFSYCDLKNLIIRDGLEQIPEDAFEGNDELTFVVVPGSVKHIGEDAFRACDKLETVILCEGVETVGSSALENIKVLALPDSLRSVGTSGMGEPNPTNSNSTVYCNDGSYGASRFESVADVIVGYNGFIKNYNLEDYT